MVVLLDSQYKVLSEKILDSHLTLFEALDQEDKAIYVLWYSLYNLEEENAFEEYRQLLRFLKGKNLAAIHNLVARPGAHYVAWYKPSPSSKSLKNIKSVSEDIEEILKTQKREISEAQVYMDADGIARVYMLPFCPPIELDTPKLKNQKPQLTTLIESHTRHKAPHPLVQFWRFINTYLPAFIMFCLGISLLWLSFRDYINIPTLQVPEVIGKPVEEAVKELHSLGFKLNVKAVPNNELAGKVLSITPPEASWLRKGQEIHLQYGFSKNQLPVKQVPELAGFKDVNVVRSLLTEAGLKLGKIIPVATNIEKNTVIAQSYLAGESLSENGLVDIIISDGPKGRYSYMPDLRGLLLEEARSFARLIGLNYPIEVEWRPNTNLQTGTVIAQNIAPEHLVNLQSATLRLVVAGKDTLNKTAPNFIGMSLAQAEKLAKQQNLILEIKEISTLNLLDGVIAQDPPPHGVLKDNSTLTITINVHAETNMEFTTVERNIPYSWFIEFGISQQLAKVTAETDKGERIVVEKRYIEGGQEISGNWKTSYEGKITFYLTLNDIDYSIPLVIEPQGNDGGLEP